MDLREMKIKSLILDLIFYPMGIYLFFNRLIPVVIAVFAIMLLAKLKLAYKKDLYTDHFNGFMDFLNYLSSHISIGQTVKYAILNFSPTAMHPSTLQNTLIKLKKNLILNGSTSDFSKIIAEAYPIGETHTFNEQIQLAIHSNSQSLFIVNKTLDVLFLKKETYEEIEMILFQKKLEQMILCLAPLFIIIFIRATSSEYLSVLYDTIPGQIIMGLSFGLLIVMKHVSDRIVQIKLEV